MHTPLNPDAVREAMPVLFELIKNEPDARVRAVLGHFIFVYIHPYMDGNGRIARFLMNAMLISGGYNWTIIPVEKRQEYMVALEKASVNEDISDFTLFLVSLVHFNSK
jgi:Fic family protein